MTGLNKMNLERGMIRGNGVRKMDNRETVV